MPYEMDAVGRIDMIGLTYGEHLIIWGLRRIVTWRGADGLFLDECLYAFGDDGADAVGTFCVFLRLLGRAAWKTFEIGPPGALALTRDERQILTLLAAAQMDDDSGGKESGGQARLDAHLRWIAAPVHRAALAQATLSLAQLLAAHGHRFPLDAPSGPTYSDDTTMATRRFCSSSLPVLPVTTG
jgi:hypothetical protein